MISLGGLITVIRFPIDVLWQVVRYYTVGCSYRKYKNRLPESRIITAVRRLAGLKMLDAKFVASDTAESLLTNKIPQSYKSITDTLNNYGKRFDTNSVWLVEKPDRTSSDPVLLYLHGGAYVMGLSSLQVHSLLAIYKLLDPSKQKNLSILILDYKLACHGHTLPTQLNQLGETYKSLVKTTSNILLLGDSAGGHLAVTHLLNLKKQQASLFPTKVLLVSPWVKIVPEPYQFKPGKSYYDNANRDMIDHSVFMAREPQQIIGDGSYKDIINSPGNVPLRASDYDNIATLRDTKSDVFIIAGEDESFRDDILEWAEAAVDVPLASRYTYGDSDNVYNPEKHSYIRKRGPNSPYVRVHVEPWGVHDAALALEHTLLAKIRDDPRLSVDNLSREEYFGIIQIVEFLNETL